MDNVPEWSQFKILAAAKYLGMFMGAGAKQWIAAVANISDRVRCIAACRAPPSVAMRMYNPRALSVAGYLAQPQPLPEALSKRETFFTHAILHLPQNTFSLKALFNLSLAGGPKLALWL